VRPEPIQTAAGDIFFTLGVSQTIPLLTKLELAGNIAAAEARMAVEQLNYKRVRLIADVEKAYWKIYLLERNLEITEQNRLILQDLERVVDARYRVNQVAQQDLLRVQTELAELRDRENRLHLRRAAAAAALNQLMPEGYYLRWAGSYERNIRAKNRLALLVPLVLITNLFLIFLQFKRWPLTMVIFLAIPVAFAGGFILLDFWPQIQNAFYTFGLMDRPFPGSEMYLTVAVWVGFIALFGIAVDDGVVIGTYLDQVFGKSPITRYEEIEERVIHDGTNTALPYAWWDGRCWSGIRRHSR